MYNYKIKNKELEDIKPLFDVVNEWDARHYDHKDAGDFSATKVIDTPRRVQLLKRHQKELSLPISSKISAFFGDGVHNLYEKYLQKYEDYKLEQRYKFEVLDRLITGKFDILYKDKHLYDVKTTKAWKIVFDPKLEDWHEQQNIYAWLLFMNGIEVTDLNIVAHYVDWTEGNALRDKTYPQSPVVEYELELWDFDVTEQFVTNKIKEHISYENTPDDELPECPPKDRWERFPNGSLHQFALFKNNSSKRATKLFDDIQKAINFGKSAKGHGRDSFIEVRHAMRKRCEKWCSAAKKCNHHAEYMERKDSGTLNDYVPLYND